MAENEFDADPDDYDNEDEGEGEPEAPPNFANYDNTTFSPDIMEQAKYLASASPFNIVLEVFRRKGTMTQLQLERPISEWSCKEVATLFTVGSTFGTSKLVARPFGPLVYAPIPNIERYGTEVLVASLRVAAPSHALTLTDSTLPEYVMGLRGVTVMDEGTHTMIDVPGMGYPIKVNGTDSRGRVASGGVEYMEFANSQFKGSVEYVHTDPDARQQAFIFLSHYTVKSVTEENIMLAELPTKDKRALGMWRWFGLKTPVNLDHINLLRRVITEAYTDRSIRPCISVKSQPLAYLEVLLTKYYKKNPRSVPDSLVGVCAQVAQARAHLWNKVPTLAPSFFPPAGPDRKLEQAAIISLRTGTIPLPGTGGKLVTYGDVKLFVTNCRLLVRDNLDVQSKSDAYGAGYLGAPASVPTKIGSLFLALSGMTGSKVFPRADAWGTHTRNHWHRTIDQWVTDITFYDLNRDYAPKLGGKFDQGDVEQLAEGSGRGKCLCDDTFNSPEGKPDSVSMDKKVASVLRAGYDCGFIKMILGAGSELITQVGHLPRSVEGFMSKYDCVYLMTGGSPHSLEYYILFSRLINREMNQIWSPPRPGADGYGPCVQAYEERTPEAQATVTSRLKGWYLNKVYDTVRANVMLNTQLVAMSVHHEPLVCKTRVPTPRTIRCSGYKDLNSQISDRHLNPDVADPECPDAFEV